MKLLRIVLALGLAAVAAVAVLIVSPGTPPAPLPPRNGPALLEARLWGYQLQAARTELIPPDIDLLVIDYARESGGSDVLTQADVDAFRNRAGGRPRVVLAYMSIGEAERYRAYWRPYWSSRIWLGLFRPSWLGRENKEWKGNYLVRFWEAGWQKIIFNPQPSLFDTLRQIRFGRQKPYVDQIMEAGFDGVYLDRVDAFGEWEKTRPRAEAEMSAFVQKLSAYAKARKPGFLVVPQNGEELLEREDYRKAIDGVSKEDLMFGAEKQDRPNSREETQRSIALLRKLQSDGKPVFVVEYISDPSNRALSLKRTADLGFRTTFADRALNRPPENVLPPPPITAPVATPADPPPAIPKTQP